MSPLVVEIVVPLYSVVRPTIRARVLPDNKRYFQVDGRGEPSVGGEAGEAGLSYVAIRRARLEHAVAEFGKSPLGAPQARRLSGCSVLCLYVLASDETGQRQCR